MVGDDPELQTAWGDLLVEKHQNADAARSYRAAIRADRGYAPAYVGLGEAMADTNPPMARQLVERALTLNTSSLPRTCSPRNWPSTIATLPAASAITARLR